MGPQRSAPSLFDLLTRNSGFLKKIPESLCSFKINPYLCSGIFKTLTSIQNMNATRNRVKAQNRQLNSQLQAQVDAAERLERKNKFRKKNSEIQ